MTNEQMNELCHQDGWFDASYHPDYIAKTDAVREADGSFVCTCPYAAEIHEVVVNKVFTDDSYYETCQDI